MQEITLVVDDLDAAVIHKCIAEYQRSHHVAFGETIIPEGNSSLIGAIVAEIFRCHLEQ